MRFLSVTLTCISLFTPAALSAASPAYSVLDLGATSQRDVFLNELGQAAFESGGKAVRYTDGIGAEDLIAPNPVERVGGINNLGQVSAAAFNGQSLDILRSGGAHGWDIVSGASGQRGVEAPGYTFVGPNDNGDMAVAEGIWGEYISGSSTHRIGYPGWPPLDVYITDINNTGQALAFILDRWGGGLRSVLYTDPDRQNPLPGGMALGLNNRGDIVGESFIRWNNGSVTQLPRVTPGDPQARDLNDFGQVVGNNQIGDDFALPWVATTDAAYDLNALIDPSLDWNLTYARSINNAGQIAGTGFLNGQRHAFRLSPTNSIPEPGSLALLCVSILPLLAALRRRPNP